MNFSFKAYLWDMDYVDVSYKDFGYKFRSEALHWLVLSEDKKVSVIIVFDLIQRSLAEIFLSDHLTFGKYEDYCLRVMGGCLGVSCLVIGFGLVYFELDLSNFKGNYMGRDNYWVVHLSFKAVTMCYGGKVFEVHIPSSNSYI